MEKGKKGKKPNLTLNRLGIILASAPIAIFCLFTKAKGQTFRGIPGFYSTSGAVDYTEVIFFAHLVAVKCEVFTTSSARDMYTAMRSTSKPSDAFPLLPANFVRQSIEHVLRFK